MSSPDTTALVVVDMQNAFIASDGGAAVAGADSVVVAVNARITDAVARGWPVFYTHDIAPLDLPPDDPDRQTDLHPDLVVDGTVVDKGPGKDGGMSGFVLRRNGIGDGGLSELAEQLRATGCGRVVVVGLAADVCVAATARDARRLGYEVTVDLPASAFVHAHADGDDAAVADLIGHGVWVDGPG